MLTIFFGKCQGLIAVAVYCGSHLYNGNEQSLCSWTTRYEWGISLWKNPLSKPRADIRIRIRGRIGRVHVGETVIRAIIRIATDLRTVRDKPVYQWTFPAGALLEVKTALGRPSQRNLAREFVKFREFAEDSNTSLRTRKDLLGLGLGRIEIGPNFIQGLVRILYPLNVLEEPVYNKRLTDKWTLIYLRAGKVLALYVRGKPKTGERAIILNWGSVVEICHTA